LAASPHPGPCPSDLVPFGKRGDPTAAREFLGFVTNQTRGGAHADQRALADQWRKANDHIKDVEAREAGWADGVTIRPTRPMV
jgi:hypothetical protein